jgi:hypothetical protein
MHQHVLVPISRDCNIVRNVRLANGAAAYKSLLDLFEEIVVVLYYTLELSPSQLLSLSRFVLSTLDRAARDTKSPF